MTHYTILVKYIFSVYQLLADSPYFLKEIESIDWQIEF